MGGPVGTKVREGSQASEFGLDSGLSCLGDTDLAAVCGVSERQRDQAGGVALVRLRASKGQI